jgi:hypothetical protein
LENCDKVWNVLSEVIPTKNSKKKISKQESDCFDSEKLNQHFMTAVAKKANEIELSEESYSALISTYYMVNSFHYRLLTTKLCRRELKICQQRRLQVFTT